MNRAEKLHNISFLLKLLSSAVNETDTPQVPENIDFQYIFDFAVVHKVANTAFYAVEKLSCKPDGELYKKWSDVRNKNIHKNMIQTTELASITQSFVENNITFMSVKGLDICALYPALDYRTMNDLDILVKENQLDEAVKLMKAMGYSGGKKDATHEKSLTKPPFMVVELHRDLVNINSPHYRYFSDFFHQYQSDSCQYKMADEDFYVYNMAHLHKHYTSAGCGIRSIMDLYLINKKMLPGLNKEYVAGQLEELKLTSFSKEMSQIAEKWFGNFREESFGKQERYIFSSGTYGTRDNMLENIKADKTKAQYLRFRFFPPLKEMQNLYLPLRKHPYLLPAFYVYRIAKAPFNRK